MISKFIKILWWWWSRTTARNTGLVLEFRNLPHPRILLTFSCLTQPVLLFERQCFDYVFVYDQYNITRYCLHQEHFLQGPMCKKAHQLPIRISFRDSYYTFYYGVSEHGFQALMLCEVMRFCFGFHGLTVHQCRAGHMASWIHSKVKASWRVAIVENAHWHIALNMNSWRIGVSVSCSLTELPCTPFSCPLSKWGRHTLHGLKWSYTNPGNQKLCTRISTNNVAVSVEPVQRVLWIYIRVKNKLST